LTLSQAGAAPPAAPTKAFLYAINGERSLSEVALRLYGNANQWEKIAKWNKMGPPYKITPSTKLSLQEKPTLTRAQGDQLVLQMWMKRLSGRMGPVTKEPKAASQQQAFYQAIQVTAPIPKKASAQAAQVVQEQTKKLVAASTLDEGKEKAAAGQTAAALEDVQTAKAQSPDSLETYFHEIELLLKLGKKQQAQDVAKQIVAKRPELRALPSLQKLLEEKFP